MSVLLFPTIDDRTLVRRLIANFARGKCDRLDMVQQVAHVLETYRVKRLSLGECTVSILDYFGDVPVIDFAGNQISDLCPGCGAKSDYARYLRTQEENWRQGIDIITVFCFECGTIFDTETENGMGEEDGA